VLRRRWALRNFNHFDHEKYWITGHRQEDGSLRMRAILGGMNIASEYAYGGTDRVDEGTGRARWRDLGNRRTIERLYRTLLRATPEGSPIRIQSAYFSPGPRFITAFVLALRRGSALTVVTNSTDSIDVPLIPAASRYQYRMLMRADREASLYEWKHRPEIGEATLHSKAASFGHCGPVMIGSADLDGQSSEHSSESVVLIEDPTLRAAFDDMFDADISQESATKLTDADLTRGGFLTWLQQWGVYRLGWYFLSGG
jgi:phosphatidylserine/phosphatidylglycerophosphate/cardiolipin synthase-like enzyme